ncbi:MAG: DUF89 family protein [Deltaproteobacteria bacterium]|nr:DUF89 family protein [Deltaproteobacteria bacterium]
MKTYLDCIPCFVNQALRTGRLATSDETIQREILDRVMKKLIRLPLHSPPPRIAQEVYEIIRKITGNEDPYAAIKKRHNEITLGLYPKFREMTHEADDPLFYALRLAIAGNSIDLGIEREVTDIEGEIFTTLSLPVTVNHYDALKESLRKARTILYLGDNAGEIVFDRLLMETLLNHGNTEIIFAVREKPVINDATMEDAKFVGIDTVATVISNGSDAPATILSECSPFFRETFHRADMIIAKGQGNYESLSDEPGEIFFLFKAKCRMIATHLHVNVGDSIIKKQSC